MVTLVVLVDSMAVLAFLKQVVKTAASKGECFGNDNVKICKTWVTPSPYVQLDRWGRAGDTYPRGVNPHPLPHCLLPLDTDPYLPNPHHKCSVLAGAPHNTILWWDKRERKRKKETKNYTSVKVSFPGHFIIVIFPINIQNLLPETWYLSNDLPKQQLYMI